MRVALDASATLSPPTGVGRYAHELARALEGAGIDVTRFGVSLRGADVPGINRWKLPASLVYRSWRRVGLPSPAPLVGDAELVHGTNFILPPIRRGAGVVTVHDLWFLRDEDTPLGFLKQMVPWSLDRAAVVITPTSVVADEVADTYGVDRLRIAATHLGISKEFFGARALDGSALAKLSIRKPFALAVGTIQPRKNLRRLLSAWTSLRGELPEWTLVVAGGAGWGAELPETPGVVSIGYVDQTTLPALTAAADLFCFPSLEEGFGFPPLEAMAAGTPVVAGRYAAAPEVLGDAAHLVDPLDEDSIAQGILRVAGDEEVATGLVAKGMERARLFTWEATAAATIGAYKQALQS